MKPTTLKAMHAEWRKFSPNLDSTLPERELRLAWATERLKFRDHEEGGHWTTIDGKRVFIKTYAPPSEREPVRSWSDLTQGEARYLLRKMREESGSAAAYRAQILAQLALELWGHDWDECLRDRLASRYHVGRASDLMPAQAHALIEELASRVGRGTGETLEAVRHRVQAGIKGQRAGNRGQESKETAA